MSIGDAISSGGETVARRPAAKGASRGVSLAVFLFLVALIFPFMIQLGPIRLSPYRIVLIAVTLPLVIKLLSGAAGRMRFPDYAVIIIWAWQAMSFIYNHEPGVWVQAAGIGFFETVGAYLLARVHIRTPEDFHAMVLLMFRIMLCLAPFAVLEALTARNVILEFANKVLPAFGEVYKEPRWGLDRVQGPFEHPILYGVFCGVMIGLVYKVLGYGKPLIMRLARGGGATVIAALALSSGPLTAIVAQLMLLGWEGIFGRIRKHWRLLLAGVIGLIVLIELAANRSSPEIFISYFAFNTQTAFNRILIWHFGSISVANFPIFGIGFNEWQRPFFMSDSMDMFWLVHAVRGGLVPGLLFQAIMFWTVWAVAKREGLSERVSWYRIGFATCLVGYYLSGWTVHFWNATYVQYMFLLGSGMWLLDWREREDDHENGSQSLEPPGDVRPRPAFFQDRPAPYGAELRRSDE